MPEIKRFASFPKSLLSLGLDPNFPLTMGQVFFVDSGDGNAQDDTAHGNSPSNPFATIDYAIGQCTANNGDVILVLPGHAETVTAADGIDADVAGVNIIGLGAGSARPTITYTTATAADLEVAAANVLLRNLIFVCNIASQVACVTVAAAGDGCVIKDCEFREGSTTGVSFIVLGDADDVLIEDCRFFAPTAGNYDEAIHITAALDRLTIRNCHIRGDFDDACIHNPTSAVATNLLIENNSMNNLLAGAHAMEIVSASTGTYRGNAFASSALATSIDPGSLLDGGGNTYTINGVDAGAGPAAQSGAFIPGLGFRVSKTDCDVTAAADDCFTVTGKNLVTLVHGEVTTLIAGGTTPSIKLNMKTNSVDLCAATTVTADAAGTLYMLSGDQDDAANGGDAPTVDHAQLGDAAGHMPMIVDGDIIESTTTGTATAGVIRWDVYYIPLEQGAQIVAA